MKHTFMGLGLLFLILSSFTFAEQKNQDYPLTVEILGFESNPYTTSGGTNTRCSDYGYGVNCSSSQYTWRHVQNTMAALINGQRYVIACTASVRWSKCRPLNMGTYRARQVKHGIEIVSYDEKGKPHAATYAVVGGMASTQSSPPSPAVPVATNAPPPVSAPPAGGATIAVSSTPAGADIILDGSFAGNTPSSIGVAPGEHTIRVIKKGYDEWERKIRTSTGIVNLAADLQPDDRHQEPAPAAVALHKAQQERTSDAGEKEQVANAVDTNATAASRHDKDEGTVSITSDPAGAEIFIDSVGHGQTPSLVRLQPGIHSVQIVKQGYKDWVQQVSISSGSLTNITATMTPSAQ